MALKNVETRVVGNTLTITVDLSRDFGLSTTQRSRIVASTGGTRRIPGSLNPDLRIALSVFNLSGPGIEARG